MMTQQARVQNDAPPVNAISRVVFLRWWRRGWGTGNPNGYDDGYLQINYSDDASGATVKTQIKVADDAAGEALVYSIAAQNGLALRDESEREGRCWQTWDIGARTGYLHGWPGHETDPAAGGNQ